MAPKPDKHIVARLFAKATTKLGLATTIAALWLTAVPIASAVAQVVPDQISAARAAAFSSATAWPNDIRYTTGVTPKSICIGPAWRDMANKNDWQSAAANDLLSVYRRFSVWGGRHAQRAAFSP
jgi:hypothetical protein